MQNRQLLKKLIYLTAIALIVIAAMAASLLPFQKLAPLTVHSAAVTINVDTTVDEYDTLANGSCSLREAIESINTDTSFGGCTNPGNLADTVQLGAFTYTVSITGPYYDNSAGSLRIDKENVSILGAGAGQTIISGTASLADKVFYISPGNPTIDNPSFFVMQGMTIQGGNSTGSGGGIYFEEGSANNFGLAVTFSDLVIRNNQTTGSGGGMYINPVSQNSVVTITDVLIENNQSGGNGGGLYVAGGTFNLSRMTVSNNQADYGSGIYASNHYNSDIVSLSNITVYSNTAQYSGGGLYVNNSTNPNAATTLNVSFAHNRAISATGGSIYNRQSNISLKNTIIAYGTDISGPNNCAGDPTANITSQGHNLDSGNSCALSASGDLSAGDPLLDTLADNGGNTPTLALLSGSPALNAGDSDPAGLPATDQRGPGFPRINDGVVDIGAFEGQIPANNVSIASGITPSEFGPTGGTFGVFLSSAAPAGGLGIDFTVGGTADDPDDYSLAAGDNIDALSGGRFTVTQGEMTGTLTALTVDDSVFDARETVVITLTAASSGFSIFTPKATLTIQDNEPPPPVDILLDENDGDYSPGDFSLREALDIANNGNTITFDVGLTGVITLNQSVGDELVVNKNLTVAGPGASVLAVSGNYTSTVFTILSGAEVEISGLTISNGFSGQNNDGGGIYNYGSLTLSATIISGHKTGQSGNGGAIYNEGVLIVNSSAISNNQTTSNGYGAGIYNNSGALTVTNSIILNNKIIQNGYGGGIYNTGGSLLISNTTFYNNSGYYGSGAIHNTGGSSAVVLANSTLSNNRTDPAYNFGAGGAIYQQSGTFTISNSTLSGNTATRWGGGIYLNSGTLNLLNTTVTTNTADPSTGRGGGIYASTSGNAFINHTIIAGNAANQGPDAYGAFTSDGFNIVGDASGSTGFENDVTGVAVNLVISPTLQNNGGDTDTHALVSNSLALNAGDLLFAGPPFTDQRGPGFPRVNDGIIDIGAVEGNIPANNVVIAPSGNPNEQGPTNGAFNISLSSPAPSGGVTVDYNLAGTAGNPADYSLGGGTNIAALNASTFTVAAGAISATIDVIPVDDAVFDFGEIISMTLTAADSGFSIYNSQAELTIIENNPLIPVDILLDEMDGNYEQGDLALREAVFAANPGDTVTFDSSLSGTITLTLPAGEIAINKDLSIAGPGAMTITVSAGNTSRIFNIGSGVEVEISGLTLSDGNSGVPNHGGAIYNAGRLTLRDSVLANNQSGNSARGGGIFNAFGNSLVVQSSVSSGNRIASSGSGGGIYNDSGSSLVVQSSVFSGNQAGNFKYGGAIYNYGDAVTVTNSTFYSNSAYYSGGAIRNTSGVMTVLDSTFSGNTTDPANAVGRGGAIRNDGSGQLTVVNSTFSGNQTTREGGGIYNSNQLTVIHTTITTNTVSDNVNGRGGGIYNSGTAVVSNSIIAGNAVATSTVITGAEVYGAFVSNGFNALGVISGSTGFAGDVITNVAASAVLSPTLQNNGGDTGTHALISGSPAIDAAAGADCTASPVNGLDQRGFARDTNCDIGAYEFNGQQPPLVTVLSRLDASPTNAAAVKYQLGFSEDVTGVDVGDFSLTTTGLTGTGVLSVTGSGSVYTLTVNTGNGNGTLQASVIDDNSIINGASTPLGGFVAGSGNFAGETYTVDNVAPVITVDALTTNNTAPELTGAVDDSTAVLTLTVNAASYPAANNGDGSWTLAAGTITPTLADGTYDVAVTATDTFSNAGTDNTTGELVIDTTAPTITVDSLVANSASPQLTGAVNDSNASIAVTVAANTYPAGNNGNGTWTLAAGSITPTLVEATYEVTATATDLAANSATDGTNNELLVDLTAPSAVAALSDVMAAGGAIYSFTVTYSDSVAIDAGSLDDNDIRITDPQSSSQLAALGSAVPAVNNSVVTATYYFNAPNNSWNFAHNGSYTISVEAGQVQDTATNSVPAGSLGIFQVNIQPAGITIVSGDAQSAIVNAAFVIPLGVRVADSGDTPLEDVPVVFTAPDTGPSGLFGGNSVFTASTNAGGLAEATITANALTGTYTVAADSVPAAGGVSFSLTNVASGTNLAPIAVDDAATTSRNAAVNIDVLANDTDPNNDPISLLAVGNPITGAAQANVDGTVTYTPTTNFSGTDSFTYTITDGALNDTATVVVTVTEADLTPTKEVAGQGGNTGDLALSSIVTYTITLSNGGEVIAAGVTVMDTLPPEVSFGGWIISNTAQYALGSITWGPNDVLIDTQVVFIFTATIGSDTALLGETVENTVQYTSDNAGTKSAVAGFTITTGGYSVYLPLVLK